MISQSGRFLIRPFRMSDICDVLRFAVAARRAWVRPTASWRRFSLAQNNASGPTGVTESSRTIFLSNHVFRHPVPSAALVPAQPLGLHLPFALRPCPAIPPEHSILPHGHIY